MVRMLAGVLLLLMVVLWACHEHLGSWVCQYKYNRLVRAFSEKNLQLDPDAIRIGMSPSSWPWLFNAERSDFWWVTEDASRGILPQVTLFAIHDPCGTVTDLTPLDGPHLTKVSIVMSGVTDLSALNQMTLEELEIVSANVSDIKTLRGVKVKHLLLTYLPISDIEPLRGMNLITLSLSGTNVSDLSPLKDMSLQELELCDTPAAKKPLPEWLRKSKCKVITKY